MADTAIARTSLILSTNMGQMIVGLNTASSMIGKFAERATNKLFDMSQGVSGALRAIGLPASFSTMIGAISDQIDKASKSARTLGLSVSDFQGLAHAADLSGVSAEDFTKLMGKLGKTMFEARDGNQAAIESLANLGVAGEALEGMNPGEALATIADEISAIEDPLERLGLAQRVFGKQAAAILPMLQDGGDAIREMAAESQSLGFGVSDEDAASIEEMNDTFTRVKMAIQGIYTQLTVTLAGPLTALGNMLIAIWQFFLPIVQTAREFLMAGWDVLVGVWEEMRGSLEAIWQTIQPAIIGIAAVYAGFLLWQGAVAIFGMLQAAMTALWAIMMANPVMIIAMAIGAVIAMFVDWASVIDEVTGAVTENGGVTNMIFRWIANGVGFVLDIWKILKGFVMQLVSWIQSAFAAVVGAVARVLEFAGRLPGRVGRMAREAAAAARGLQSRTSASAAANEREATVLLTTRMGSSAQEINGFFDNLRNRQQQAQDQAERTRQRLALLGDIAKFTADLQGKTDDLGKTEEEKKIEDFRERGATDEQLQGAIRAMNRNLAANIRRENDPTIAMRQQIERLQRAYASGSLSAADFAFATDRAMSDAERSLNIGGELKAPQLVMGGSSAAVEQIIKHNMGEVNMDPQERMARIMEIQGQTQQAQLRVAQDTLAALRGGPVPEAI